LTLAGASGTPIGMPKQFDPLTSFIQRGLAAQQAADDAVPKATLEQLSALSLLQARAAEAAINFRKAIDTAPLSGEARAELWRDFVNHLPK
jgi:hypothetical protein